MEFRQLTDEQRHEFEQNGYLIIPKALHPAALARLTAAVDRLYTEGVAAHGLNKAGAFELRNAVVHDDALLDLLDCPTTVPLAVQLLGWNVQLDTSHIIVRPPQPAETSLSFKASGWHRDGGIATLETPEPLARTRLKVCYVLSDLSAPGRGNTRFVPGSHRLLGAPARLENDIDPVGAREILAAPGDAILFENRLYHAVGPNLSTIVRKTIFMGYTYRWLRPLDYVVQPAALEARVLDDSIRWQLLGFWRSDMAFSLPKDEDVPVRAWLQSNLAVPTAPAESTMAR
ncbi:MAG: phytanoyl-CoA dioxygenase family protein [Chloroflexota bacterium]